MARKKVYNLFDELDIFEQGILDQISKKEKKENKKQIKKKIEEIPKDFKIIETTNIKVNHNIVEKSDKQILEEMVDGKFSVKHTALRNSIIDPKHTAIPNPEEMEYLAYTRYIDGFNQKIIEEDLSAVVNDIIERLEILSGRYTGKRVNLSKYENTEKFIEDYRNLYEEIVKKIKEIGRDPKVIDHTTRENFFYVISYITKILEKIEIIGKKQLKIITNQVNPIPGLIKNVHSVLFTEQLYLKEAIGKKVYKNPVYLGKYMSKELLNIKDESIDLAVVIIHPEEQKVVIDKEERIEIKRCSSVNKLIEKGEAKENLVLKYSLPVKIKNYGLIIYIAPATFEVTNHIKNKKHEFISVPLINIATKANVDSKHTLREKEINGKKANIIISIHAKLPIKVFEKTAIEEEKPIIFVDDLRNIEEIFNRKEFEITERDIKEFNQIKITKEAQEIAMKLIDEIIQEETRKRNKTKVEIINFHKSKIEKAFDVNEINENLIKIGKETNKIKSLQRLFVIKTVKSSKESALSQKEEEKIKTIEELANKLYREGQKSDEKLLLFLGQINKLMDTSRSSQETLISNSYLKRVPTLGQLHYLKPFDIIFNQKDFLRIIKEKSDTPYKRQSIIKELNTYLYEQKNLQKEVKESLRNSAMQIKTLIEIATKKEFKTLKRALQYIFSEEFSGELNRNEFLAQRKNIKNEIVHRFFTAIRHLDKKENIKILYKNGLYLLKAQYPALIRRIRDIYRYIDNKEEVFSKITVEKTVEKIEKMEKELQKINQKN